MIKREPPLKRTGLVQWHKKLSTTQKILFWTMIILLGGLILGIVKYCNRPDPKAIDLPTNTQPNTSGGIILNVHQGDVIINAPLSERDRVPEPDRPEQMQEQEREKDPQIGMPMKETKHQESTTTNVALDKPVAGVYIDVKRADGSELGKTKKRFALAVDGRRLSSFVMYHERYSINVGGYACNLTDGDLATSAYPAALAFDYIIDLKQKYQLTEIRLDWGDTFGSHSEINNYITRWELYGQDSFSTKNYSTMEDWELITKGDMPGKKITIVSENLKKPVRRLRIRASSEAKDNRQANWIGIHEIEAYGTPLNNN